jgi:hypothetical protein
MGQRNQVAMTARAELGYVEGPADNQTKYQKANQPWCGAFVNWVFRKNGVSIPDCTSTLAGATAFKKAKQWQDAETATPEVGDLIFCDFPGDGVDRISHVGIVVAVGDGWVKTIEGNTAGDKKKSTDERNGGEVAQKQRGFKKVNEKKLPVYIVGFAKPAFED